VIHYRDDTVTLLLGDSLEVLRTLPDDSVDCIVTSPPYYGLRDYGTEGQYGLEPTPADYVETMRRLFAEARRVLACDGTLWLNLGDSYAAEPPGDSEHGMRSSTLQGKNAASPLRESVRTAGVDRSKFLPRKNLLGIPWRVAFALQDDGWILRNELIWHKPNAMPESVRDRLSNRHEHVFMFAKSSRYWFDLDAIREPHVSERAKRFAGTKPGGASRTGKAQGIGVGSRTGGPLTGDHSGSSHPKGRNPGDVWSINTAKYPEAHFATFPLALPTRCIKAGCKHGGTVLDPFSGSGTTGAAARQLDRRYIGVDLNPEYHELAKQRFAQGAFFFDESEAS
jgi:site-specific DNA-methyltransferase (cytosine-N4-specific)